jgi:hypothetical protein
MTQTAKPRPKAEPVPPIPDWLLRERDEDAKRAVPFNANAKVEKQMVIEAASFQGWVDAQLQLPALKPSRRFAPQPDGGVVTIGKWVLYRRVLPVFEYKAERFGFFWLGEPRWRRACLPLLRNGRLFGSVRFTHEVTFPILADAKLEPWMSPTPSEVWSQRPGLRAARGRVLVGGLGLGWFAQAVREKKGVREVVVVERDPDIAAYFGDHARRFLGVPFRVEVADFYEYAEARHGEFDSIVADIWKEFGDAGWDRRFQALKRSAGCRVWGWGDYVPRD